MGSWGEGVRKRLTRVNHIREVEKQRARQANKLLGRREVGCSRSGITPGRVDRREKNKLNRKLFAESLVDDVTASSLPAASSLKRRDRRDSCKVKEKLSGSSELLVEGLG